jgi:hypothetical protein
MIHRHRSGVVWRWPMTTAWVWGLLWVAPQLMHIMHLHGCRRRTKAVRQVSQLSHARIRCRFHGLLVQRRASHPNAETRQPGLFIEVFRRAPASYRAPAVSHRGVAMHSMHDPAEAEGSRRGQVMHLSRRAGEVDGRASDRRVRASGTAPRVGALTFPSCCARRAPSSPAPRERDSD